jgi:hypothetical protein
MVRKRRYWKLATSYRLPLSATTKIPNTEPDFAGMSLMRLQHFGAANLFEWAARESAALAAKPSIHREFGQK